MQILGPCTPPMYSQFKWGTFAGHCFHSGVLGHVIVECPRKRNNAMEVVHVQEPIEHRRVQYLTISEQIKDNDGKTLEDEGQCNCQ